MSKMKNDSLDDQQDQVRDSIRKVLEQDIESYLARDRDAWEQCWVQDERFQSIMECGTLQVARSYKQFRDNIFDAMNAEIAPVDANMRIENLTIDFNGNLAWATYEEIIETTTNPMAAPSHSHNFRLLECENGSWRILFHGCWAEPLRDIEGPAIEVTKDGVVVWLNAAAESRITSFAGLTISNGVLRTSKPSLNTGLHSAIVGAHNLTSFGLYNRAKNDGGGEVSFPVVLGENDNGVLLMCWVKVADGRVYILFDTNQDLSQQIEVARTVYGLSQTQTSVVECIAREMEITDIVNELGITKNTVRTHLRRVYEKTGVSSQIELLRLLISFRL